MKSKFMILLTLLAALLIPIMALDAHAEETAIPVVYLDAANGADTNDGLTEATAVQTVEKAYEVLGDQIGDSTQGKILLVNDYTFTFGSDITNQKIAADAHTYEVIITGKTSDVCFYVAASVAKQSWLGLQGPTTFESITMKIADSSAYTNIVICGNGGLFKIGEGVQTGTSNLLRLMAGPAATHNGDMSLEVHSGSWQDLCAGAYAYTMTGNASFAMYGGSVVNLETTFNGKHNGDVSIAIYGGTVDNLYGGSRNKSGVITGNITVCHYGGTVTKQNLNGVGTLNGNAKLVTPEAQTISLRYDDRKDLEGLLGYTAVDVRISNEQVDSYKVGTDTKDEHVIIYENGKLIAVGVGTADLTVGVATHKVTVTPAIISMFMITGHSVGAGDGGSIGQSVVCEDGQVYSSHRPYSITSAEGGLGYGADLRAGCTNSAGETVGITSQQHLDAFTAAGVGCPGEGSAFGYQWNKLTGEKVWILNFAVGGSCLNEWQTGVKGHATWTEYHYDTAVKAFGYAQEVVKNEIAAGHYTFGHMAMLYHNGVNDANYPGWTDEQIEADYEAMWNGYKAALATDMDGDEDIETLEGLGIVPFYNFTNRYNDLFDKPAGYYMASSAEYPDVFLASNIYFNWMKEEGLSTFPTPNYPVQNGTTLKVPVSVAHKDNGGTSENSVFCKADNMHPTQVVHNATGMQLAQSMYAYLYEAHETTQVVLKDQAHNVMTQLDMTVGESKHLVPYITPNVKGNVTYAAEGAVSLRYPLQVVANEIGTGTVTAKVGDRVLATVTVTVTENTHIHCVCGGEGAKHHSCEDLIWTAWGDDAYERDTLPFLSGNYYLTADITVAKSMLAEPGETIRICLNGHSIHTGTERVANVQGYLAITDCREMQGTLSSAYTSKYTQICYVYANATLDIYGGITDPQGQSARGASVFNQGTTNVYGGTINGDTNVLTDNLEARGGAIYILEGQVNLYGGTINGGYATKGGAIYMDSSTLVIDGATITGGEATMGGNIFADYLSKVEIRSGLIENGHAKYQGGNLYLYTTAKDGAARNASMTISGGTIQKGVADDRGSNIFVTTGTTNSGDWVITVTGGEILGGKDNIILRNNGQLRVQGGTITANGYSVQFERSSDAAPTPVLSLKDSFTLGTVYMEAGKGLIRLDSENVSPVTLMGSLSVQFFGSDEIHALGAVIDRLSLNPAVTGFGYKASFTADETVQALLSEQGYTLWLDGGNTICRNAPLFRNELTLRLKNVDIENYGSAKIGAKVFLQLTNGLTVESEAVSYSMQDMVENISADLSRFSAEQIRAVQTMLAGFQLDWSISELLAWTEE